MKFLLTFIFILALFFPFVMLFQSRLSTSTMTLRELDSTIKQPLDGTSPFSLGVPFPVFTGNSATTFGEARKVVFEHALGIIGRKFQGGNVINATTRFLSFSNTRVISSVSRSMVSSR